MSELLHENLSSNIMTLGYHTLICCYAHKCLVGLTGISYNSYVIYRVTIGYNSYANKAFFSFILYSISILYFLTINDKGFAVKARLQAYGLSFRVT